MKFLFLLILTYLLFRFVQRAFFSPAPKSRFRVVYPNSERGPGEKDISDRVRVLETKRTDEG
ncbi:hypothetical protein CH373_04645 [Leptospira perolatii]|uniref:Uncharacterized protein n=1 Tax=Leptospira perolatii TaxID=2023191 RepID=A0A2M9ZQA2_9LEPT|nr:hypothetical protein CH373_04645 [Leptospira perolatii]